MVVMDAYWITASSTGTVAGTVSHPLQNTSKLKDAGDVSVISQPTMVNFANIFAGATAAVASCATSNSDLLGNNGKNFMIGHPHSVPSLNQIAIPSANQLSKRNGVFPITGTLPGMGTINNIGMANTNVIISGSTTPLNNTLQQVTSNHLTYTSAPQMTISVAKDFIQQAAAESGVVMDADTAPIVQPHIYAIQQQVPVSLPTSSLHGGQLIQVAAASPATTNVSSEQENVLKCGDCNQTFKQAGQLSYHTFVAHAQLQARPHKCASCPESFLEAHHLQDHVKAVHSNQDAGVAYTCSECETSFANGGHLNYHIYMAHTVQGHKTLPHACTECGKSFMKANLLNSHMKNVHGTSGSGVVSSAVNGQIAMQAPESGKQYACSDCDKVFKLPLYLKQHVLSSHDKPHKCEECGKGFGRRSDLNRHTRGVHMRERPHSCNKCGWTFAEAGNLKHHMLAVHSKEKNYRCPICSKCFSTSSYLKTHMVRVHGLMDNGKTGNVQQAALSEAQPQTFVLPTEGLNNNMNEVHIAVAQSHVNRCFECGQAFSNASMLQNHVMSTHPQPFWCTVCGEGFAQACQLQYHLQVRHSDGNNLSVALTNQSLRSASVTNVVNQPSEINLPENPQTEKCITCGVYMDKNLKNHICPGLKFQQAAFTAAAAMAMAGERPHLCTKCGKGFKTATHLKQHVRCVHTKDRPHKCSHCAKNFARMSDLNRHVKGVHERVKPPSKVLRLMNLKCTECGAAFAETSQLKRHILTIHLHQRPCYKCADCQEGFPDESRFKSHICHEEERPHMCSVCTKRFSEPAQLRRHVRSAHSQHASHQRQHKCFDCHRLFTRPVDLERHIHAVHLKEKPHKCTFCGKYFGLHGNLNKHIRAVHMLEKPHQCVECGKCFAHIGVLKRHLRDIHFYDRRPNHNNPRHKINNSSNAVPSIQQQTQPHLIVLEAMQQQEQQHLLQPGHTAPQSNVLPGTTHQPLSQRNQVVHVPPQVITDSVPRTPAPI